MLDKVIDTVERYGWEHAIQYVEECCIESPDNGAAWELLGLLHSKQGQSQNARDHLERASLLIPLESWSSRMLAIEYINTGSRELGIDLLTELGKADHVTSQLGRLIAQDLCRLACPRLACEVLLHRITADPNNSELWHELSAAQSAAGMPTEVCMETVEKAISIAPSVAEYRVTAATLMILLDEPRGAYELACSITLKGIRSLNCSCCVWRLICLFDCFDDHERVTICYEQMRKLTGTHSTEFKRY